MTDHLKESVVQTDAGYEIELPGFSGPLDMLLQLVRREAYDIFDIPLALLTQAYLNTLDDFRQQGFEIAASFLALASELVHLKSQLMLPKPKIDSEVAEFVIDPRDALVERLLAYEGIQIVSRHLSERPRLYREHFPCFSSAMRAQRTENEYATTDVGKLALALQNVMAKRRFSPPHEVYVEHKSVGERIAEISRLLARDEKVSFASLCARLETREEVITTFLALLEMAKLSLVTVTQRDVRAPVYVFSSSADLIRRGEEAAGTGEFL